MRTTGADTAMGVDAGGLTGANVVDMLITDLAVFQRPDRKSHFKLVERAPGVTLDEIKAKTPANFV
jgi:acyl CoA:acetate/3-ketoacid CoA transferase beta subunit